MVCLTWIARMLRLSACLGIPHFSGVCLLWTAKWTSSRDLSTKLFPHLVHLHWEPVGVLGQLNGVFLVELRSPFLFCGVASCLPLFFWLPGVLFRPVGVFVLFLGVLFASTLLTVFVIGVYLLVVDVALFRFGVLFGVLICLPGVFCAVSVTSFSDASVFISTSLEMSPCVLKFLWGVHPLWLSDWRRLSRIGVLHFGFLAVTWLTSSTEEVKSWRETTRTGIALRLLDFVRLSVQAGSLFLHKVSSLLLGDRAWCELSPFNVLSWSAPGTGRTSERSNIVNVVSGHVVFVALNVSSEMLLALLKNDNSELLLLFRWGLKKDRWVRAWFLRAVWNNN